MKTAPPELQMTYLPENTSGWASAFIDCCQSLQSDFSNIATYSVVAFGLMGIMAASFSGQAQNIIKALIRACVAALILASIGDIMQMLDNICQSADNEAKMITGGGQDMIKDLLIMASISFQAVTFPILDFFTGSDLPILESLFRAIIAVFGIFALALILAGAFLTPISTYVLLIYAYGTLIAIAPLCASALAWDKTSRFFSDWFTGYIKVLIYLPLFRILLFMCQNAIGTIDLPDDWDVASGVSLELILSLAPTMLIIGLAKAVLTSGVSLSASIIDSELYDSTLSAAQSAGSSVTQVAGTVMYSVRLAGKATGIDTKKLAGAASSSSGRG